MRNHTFNTRLVVLVAALTIGATLALGTAVEASLTFLSPVSTPS